MSGLSSCCSGVRWWLLGGVLAASAGAVMATLGRAPSTFAGSPASTPPPGARVLAATPVARPGLYSLHEVKLENGTIVREYATPAGLVFAVAWRGPVLPDLTALLGDYFNTFKLETQQARTRGLRGSPVIIEHERLVVRSNGRMRDFFGHAYAPDLVPAGVDIHDVLR